MKTCGNGRWLTAVGVAVSLAAGGVLWAQERGGGGGAGGAAVGAAGAGGAGAQTAPAGEGGARGGRAGRGAGGGAGGGAGRGGAAGGPPSRASILRGEYGELRSNNDLLYYHLDIRIDPTARTVSGKNTIKFKMLKDGNKIQLDLAAALKIDKIVMGTTELKSEREANAVFIEFPQVLKTGQEYAIDFHYSGTPGQGMTFGDVSGRGGRGARGEGGGAAAGPARPWIYTSCEGPGAMTWWPNKDQWRDECETMDISVAIPNALTDVSNGKFIGKTDLGDGYTRWDWKVHYPINNYCVSVNITDYVHFAEPLKMLDGTTMSMDFWVLPENLEQAKTQFAQAKGMHEAYQKYFGDYPFAKDGYKLVQVPYAGMEHQSAVTYGNGFRNGYGNRDWTGVGISPRFDFIIIHESAHEWFGNAVSAADVSDMWIQEGWCTYLEVVYVEHHWGKEDAIKYVNGYKRQVSHRFPIVRQRGIHQAPGTNDQYFKGALFINTLRSVMDDDVKWWATLKDFYNQSKYKNIMTEDVEAHFSKAMGRDMKAVFDQYLRRTAIPVLELKFNEAAGEVEYRWKADETKFDMPIQAGTAARWEVIKPTTEWQKMKTSVKKDEFTVPLDLYYVEVTKL